MIMEGREEVDSDSSWMRARRVQWLLLPPPPLFIVFYRSYVPFWRARVWYRTESGLPPIRACIMEKVPEYIDSFDLLHTSVFILLPCIGD